MIYGRKHWSPISKLRRGIELCAHVMLVVMLFGVVLPWYGVASSVANAQDSGPYSAQIQRALRSLLYKGTAGQVLTSNGDGVAPTYQAGGSTLTGGTTATANCGDGRLFFDNAGVLGCDDDLVWDPAAFKLTLSRAGSAVNKINLFHDGAEGIIETPSGSSLYLRGSSVSVINLGVGSGQIDLYPVVSNGAVVNLKLAQVNGTADQLIFAPSTAIFGLALDSSTPAARTFVGGQGGSGTDIAGGSLTVAAGASTGTGAGGNLSLAVSPSAATGTTSNSTIARHIVVAQGKALTDATAVSLFEVALPTLTMTGGLVHACVQSTNGTDMQMLCQDVTYAAVNKGGAYTTDIEATVVGATPLVTEQAGAKAVSTGTLVNVWSVVAGTNKITVKLAADTSLTPSGTNGFVVYYTIMNNSQQVITVL